jgi:hypothetical protein
MIPCVGCGAIGDWNGELVPACPACLAEVVRVFGQTGDPVPPGGLEIPEGPATRVGDAILAALRQRKN